MICTGTFPRIVFLSTPSGWRATHLLLLDFLWHTISIHALRVEGDPNGMVGFFTVAISIHALRVEGDRLHEV